MKRRLACYLRRMANRLDGGEKITITFHPGVDPARTIMDELKRQDLLPKQTEPRPTPNASKVPPSR